MCTLVQPGLVRSATEVLANLDGGPELLVDARPAGRFEGTAPEPRAGIPSGHVPGSCSVPFPTLLTVDGRHADLPHFDPMLHVYLSRGPTPGCAPSCAGELSWQADSPQWLGFESSCR